MTKKLVLATVLLGALAISFAQRGFGPMSTLTPATTLTTEAKDALIEALTGPVGEYAAYATYDAVIQKYGALEPYLSIRDSETMHITALQRQLQKYGVQYPTTNPYSGKINLPADLKTIAQTEIKTEQDNAAMYDKLLKIVTNYPDLTRVFTNLRRASVIGHLNFFKAAAENDGSLTAAQLQAAHLQIQSQMQSQMNTQGFGPMNQDRPMRGQGFGMGNHRGQMGGWQHGPWR